MDATRNSSFELLRIILILMILIEHGNMWFIGSGYQTETEHLAKCIVESVCIGSVNAFVLISGWFGIKSGTRKIGSLVFALLFTTIPVLIIAIQIGAFPINSLSSLTGIYHYVFGGEGYWFVVAYIGLVVVSPCLNSAIDFVPQKSLKTILIVSYCLIIVYDFTFKTSVLGIEGGYSVGWFAYLYLLAAYMHKYRISRIENNVWLILLCCITVQSYLFYYGYIGLRYTNPLILGEAICLLYIFSRYKFYSKVINFIAGGCLMAYLIHMQPLLEPYIRRFLIVRYESLGYWNYMLELGGMSMVLLLIAVLINCIQTKLFKAILLYSRK